MIMQAPFVQCLYVKCNFVVCQSRMRSAHTHNDGASDPTSSPPPPEDEASLASLTLWLMLPQVLEDLLEDPSPQMGRVTMFMCAKQAPEERKVIRGLAFASPLFLPPALFIGYQYFTLAARASDEQMVYDEGLFECRCVFRFSCWFHHCSITSVTSGDVSLSEK